MDVTMNEKEWRAISHLMRDYSNNYGVSATCGYLGGFDPDWSAVNSGSMYPKNAVLTYYFSR
jgi:hypothetical protein